MFRRVWWPGRTWWDHEAAKQKEKEKGHLDKDGDEKGAGLWDRIAQWAGSEVPIM